jgi:hypothetical protein
MGIEITTKPGEITVNGTTFYMKPDPTNSDEWDTLMNTVVVYSDPKKRKASHAKLLDAMCALAYTPEDAEMCRKIFTDSTDVGTATLRNVSILYVQEATGFPTGPSES